MLQTVYKMNYFTYFRISTLHAQLTADNDICLNIIIFPINFFKCSLCNRLNSSIYLHNDAEITPLYNK